LLNIKDVYLGYYNEYIALGLTPHFKKIPKPINHTTDDDLKNKTAVNGTAPSFMDRMMSNLYKLTEDMTQPFRSKPTLQESLFDEDDDFAFFENFDKKRLGQSCEQGRCGYISEIIDELEREHQNSQV
jgi:hypothetical protein